MIASVSISSINISLSANIVIDIYSQVIFRERRESGRGHGRPGGNSPRFGIEPNRPLLRKRGLLWIQGEDRWSTVPKKSVKEEMLKVASRQFYEQGYEATSVKDIVEQCGTTAPALYHHFGSKESLALAYLDRCAQEQAERWQPVFMQDSLPAILDAWVAVIRKDAKKRDYLGCPIGNFSSQLDLSRQRRADQTRLRKKLADIMESWIDGMTQRFKQLQEASKIPRAADVTALAIQLLSVYEGGLLVWRATKRGDVVDSIEAQFKSTCQRALAG